MRVFKVFRRSPKGPQIFGVLTIGLAFTIFSVFLLGIQNFQGIVSKWQQGIEVLCYLNPDLPESKIKEILDRIKNEPQISEAKYLSSKEVQQEFLKEAGNLLEGFKDFEEELFPNLISLRLKRPLTVQELKALASRLQEIPGIKEVQYGGKWLERVYESLNFLKGLLLVGGILLFGITLFICSNTLKLIFYQRKEEIEILRLMGASESFIRIPFVIEGTLQGTLGAILSLVCSYLIFEFLQSKIPMWVLPYLPELKFFSLKTMLSIMGLGLLSGMIGGFLSCVGSSS
jgi:cell division transport system permease protein